jgi:hypothetical protein
LNEPFQTLPVNEPRRMSRSTTFAWKKRGERCGYLLSFE